MKRKKNISPTQLTLAYLRKRGAFASVTEKWIKAPFMKGGGVRKDLFHGDLMAILNGTLLNIQAGVESDHNAKVKKALTHPEVKAFLITGNKFHVWTWAKKQAFNKDGSVRAKPKWTPRVTEIYREGNTLLARPFILS